jgi:NAD(P)-dependent dehydrogenase (short-subunit alcohol dehydrogenase family)
MADRATEDRPIRDLFDLKGRLALVTGAASDGGYGRQIALALAEAGALVVITSRDREKAERRAETLSAQGLAVVGAALDLLVPADAERVVREVEREHGAVDILVNNASTNCLDPVETVALDDWSRVLAVNVTGAMLLSRAVAPAMRDQGRGTIVNVASIHGVVAPDQGIYGSSGLNSALAYGVSKAALLQMTRYLATYWAPEVRVNAITPGGLWNNQDPTFLEAYCKRTPLGRMAGPSDLKGAALFLASDASSWVTGANIIVDGGLTAW